MADPEPTYPRPCWSNGVKVSKSPWGPDDEIGRLNWVTPESTAAILDHLDGRHVFDLNVEYFVGMPSWVAAGDPPYQIWMTHTPRARSTTASGRRLRGAREVLVLRRLDPHVHALRDAHRHAQPPRLLRSSGTAGRPTATSAAGSGQGGAERYPPVIARGVLSTRRHQRRRRSARRLRDHGGPARRREARASSFARATSSSSARGA